MLLSIGASLSRGDIPGPMEDWTKRQQRGRHAHNLCIYAPIPIDSAPEIAGLSPRVVVGSAANRQQPICAPQLSASPRVRASGWGATVYGGGTLPRTAL